MHLLSQYENKLHGTSDFPVAYYDINPEHPNYIMPFHWHKEWELIHIRKGSVVFHLDDSVYTANKGDIFLLPGNMLHGSLPPEDVLYDCFVFDFYGLFGKERFLEDLEPLWTMELLPQVYYPKESNAVIYPFVAELMDTHFKHQQNPNCTDYLEAVTGTMLISLFVRILQNKYYAENTELLSASARRINYIKLVLEYIEKNYCDKITLDDLANEAGMNPRYFCRFFKQITTRTPIDYVILFRIEKACKMLATTDMSILEVALKCGFNDCSFFTRTFKKLKGCTPKEYRKQSKK